MAHTLRFVIKTGSTIQNFLSIKETSTGDLIVSKRGKQHFAPLGSEAAAATHIDEDLSSTLSITVHPNLKSEIGSITINYKNNVGGIEERIVAGILDVKSGERLIPVITSIGSNVGRPGLCIDPGKYGKDELFELWPGSGIDLKHNSLAYSVLIANPQSVFNLPEGLQRNLASFAFQHFQVIFIYWVFNQPTKFRETILIFSTPEKYICGYEFNQALNFTNDMTLSHMQVYPELPPLP